MLYWGFVQSSVSQVSHGGFALGRCCIDPSCSKNKGGAQKGAPSASIVTSLVNEGTTDVKLSAFTFTFKQLRGIYNANSWKSIILGSIDGRFILP